MFCYVLYALSLYDGEAVDTVDTVITVKAVDVTSHTSHISEYRIDSSSTLL